MLSRTVKASKSLIDLSEDVPINFVDLSGDSDAASSLIDLTRDTYAVDELASDALDRMKTMRYYDDDFEDGFDEEPALREPHRRRAESKRKRSAPATQSISSAAAAAAVPRKQKRQKGDEVREPDATEEGVVAAAAVPPFHYQLEIVYNDDNAITRSEAMVNVQHIKAAIENAYFANAQWRAIIQEPFFMKSMARNTIFVLAKNEDNQPVGFLLGRRVPDGLYLELLCSSKVKDKKGKGEELLKLFGGLADKYGWNVTLSSLAYVMGFYEKYGYEHRESCEDGAPVLPSFDLRTAPCMPNKHVRGPQMGQPNGTVNCYRTPNPDIKRGGSQRHTKFLDYMLELMDAGLMDPPGIPECTKASMDLLSQESKRRKFVENDCAMNGFLMKRCGRRKAVDVGL